MKALSRTQEQISCPPCTQGKEIRARFKQATQNRYRLLDALSSDEADPITPSDLEGNKYVQLLVDLCSGWSGVLIMKANSEAGIDIMHSLAEI